jgi:hippurate hydrolase
MPKVELDGLLEAAEAALPELLPLRRELHRNPEIGLELPDTQARIAAALRDLGLEPRFGRALSSVVAVIAPDHGDGGARAATTILRADMDALPLQEETGLEFASERAGAMHACGHDLHMTMLLLAARLLVERRISLRGPVILMFQPGEEGFAGAKLMLDEGLLDGLDPAASRALALHIWSSLPSGEIHLRAGTQMASADSYRIRLRGRGGHASKPQLAIDPIPAAAEIVTALQVALSREVDIFDPAVVTITQIHAGTTHNIIPETALLEGTLRTLSNERRDSTLELIQRVAGSIATEHRLAFEFELDIAYPATINDPGIVERVANLASELVGPERVVEMSVPFMSGEDWSYVIDRVPGAMVFLGARPAAATLASVLGDHVPDNHSNRVVFDESAMAAGAALYAAFALAP